MGTNAVNYGHFSESWPHLSWRPGEKKNYIPPFADNLDWSLSTQVYPHLLL